MELTGRLTIVVNQAELPDTEQVLYLDQIVTDKLFTSTNQSNERMQRLCESLGFIRSGNIENLDDGDPEIVYCKRLKP